MRRAVLQGTGVVLVALTVWALALLAAELLRLPLLPAPGQGSEVPAGSVRVTSVLATNRLEIEGGQTVQLGSIEVPATGERFAEEGIQAVRALALNQPVRVEGDPAAAYVYLQDGQLLQTLLVAGGYARVAADAPQDTVLTTLQAVETEAREQNLGLWGAPDNAVLPTTPPDPGPPIACEPSLIPNAIGPVEAEVALGRSVSVVFFPTRANTRNGEITLQAGTSAEEFGVVIPAGLASTVEEPGSLYVSRCLAVTGRVESGAAGAPRITLRSFDELQVLR